MAKETHKDRRVEELAVRIFTQVASSASVRGKTYEALAAESLTAARSFYRTFDTTLPEQSGTSPKE